MTRLHDVLAADEITVSVPVTQDDIDKGSREDCWRCPVALALGRVFPGLHAEVDACTLTIYEHEPVTDGPGRPLYVTRTPYDAECFIFDFDEGEPVAPFTFEVTFRCP